MLKVITELSSVYETDMDLHDGGGGQILNSYSSKIIQSSSPNKKEVIDTKHSLGKANLSSSIIG